jgi:hypothetical protein
MSGKINFAVDFINMLGLMNMRAKGGMNPVSHAATLLFLVDWGLNALELDEANKVFWDKVNDKSLEDFPVVAERMTKALKDREEDRKRLMIQMAAISELDADLTPDEVSYLKGWGETLDFRPSEVAALYDRGKQLALALTFFGKKYIETAIAAAQAPTAEGAPPTDAALATETAEIPPAEAPAAPATDA